jgi:hypothetical protein
MSENTLAEYTEALRVSTIWIRDYSNVDTQSFSGKLLQQKLCQKYHEIAILAIELAAINMMQ